MKGIAALQWGIRVSPLLMSAASVAAASPAYELDTSVAVGFCLAMLAVSFILRSDVANVASFCIGASLLALTSVAGGPLIAAATVVILLVAFDLVWLSRSLFGVVEQRSDPEDGVTFSRHLRLLKLQAWRSAIVGLLAFTVTFVALTAPFPVVAFSNPVSGTGLLALGGLLLVLLAATERGAVADLLPRKNARGG